MQSAGVQLISRALELDEEKRYTESITCYQEGIQILLDVAKAETGEKAKHIRNKVMEYMERAEKIKHIIENLKKEGKYHEQIEILDGSQGHSYEKILRRFLGAGVTEVLIEDPYIRIFHQFQNLVRFNECLKKHCSNLNKIKLVTTKADTDEQEKSFNVMKLDLKSYKIEFSWEFMQTLHDRRITLNNGWIIKIGRGLDYFKPPEFKLALGSFDMDLRKCHQTTIDIFHSSALKCI